MPAGDLSPFTVDQRRAIESAIAGAERTCGYRFSVWVGVTEHDPRDHARRLHAQLPDPARTVLVLVDPTIRALEIVTGETAHRDLDDSSAGLAALAMQTTLASGDVANAIVRGLLQLAEHARPPAMLHTDSP